MQTAIACLLRMILVSVLSPVAASSISGDAPSVAATYQRIGFMLKLDPVVWEQVRGDVEEIAGIVRASDPSIAERLIRVLNHAAEASAMPYRPAPDADLMPGAKEAEEIDVMPRQEGARQVFVQTTIAVEAIVRRRLQAVVTESRTLDSVADARDAFDAFEPALRTFDPEALKRLNQRWSELTALCCATPGVSPILEPENQFVHVVAEISQFLDENFGPGFRTLPDGPLNAVPLASPTVIREAAMPLLLTPGSRVRQPIPRPRQILNSVERGATEREMPLSTLGAAAFNNPFLLVHPGIPGWNRRQGHPRLS